MGTHFDNVCGSLARKGLSRVLGVAKDLRDEYLWTVLVARNAEVGEGEFVVWSYNEQTDGFFQGSYCGRDPAAAHAEFLRRCTAGGAIDRTRWAADGPPSGRPPFGG